MVWNMGLSPCIIRDQMNEFAEIMARRRAGGPKTAEASRLEALMEIYGMTQTAFAQAVGVSQPRVANVIGGTPLGKDLAFKIARRFPNIGLNWLWWGDPRAIYSTELENKLREIERRRGIQLFSQFG